MLTLQFVPYRDIESLTSIGRIRKLLKIAMEEKIVLLEGRLRKDEETELIKTTMEEIDDSFKGIEMAVIEPSATADSGFNAIKHKFFSLLLGNREGFTIIGPASVIREIKKDPNKIQLFTKGMNDKKKRKRR